MSRRITERLKRTDIVPPPPQRIIVIGHKNPDTDAIASARLLRPSAVTHVTDVQQRSIALKIIKRAGGLKLTIPASRGLVPPGWYMLFVTDRRGTPSEAYWIRVR